MLIRWGSPGWWVLLAACSLAASAESSLEASSTPLVVAIDTSRSLPAADFEELKQRLQVALGTLDPSTPVGVMAFDDDPRWAKELEATPDQAAEALERLAQGGQFTLLNDALFVATDALPEGGVVLLVTDGRDENSATTVDDLARRCESRDIRLLPMALGDRLDEKSLRRLALVSNGSYLGRLEELAPVAIAEAATAAIGEVVRERRGADPARPTERSREGGTAAGPATGARPPELPRPGSGGAEATELPSETAAWPSWLPWALLASLVLAFLALGVFVAGRRKNGTEEVVCDRCGSELPGQGASCERCAESDLLNRLRTWDTASPAETRELSLDTAVFGKLAAGEELEHTRVLRRGSLLLVKEPGEAPGTYVLPELSAFAVGRGDEANTLVVRDPALSKNHFKIVPWGDGYWLVDVGSTNGCFVNDRRIELHELHTGDIIRAGQVEFEYRGLSERFG